MTNGHRAATVEPAPKQKWTCPECAIQPLLGLYALSGLHIRAPASHGRGAESRQRLRHYVVDLRAGGSVLAHCFACHAWRELSYDPKHGQIQERKWTGPTPAVGCECEQEDFVNRQPSDLDPGALALPAELLAGARVPQPEELPWLDPNSDAARCGICHGLYGQMIVDPFTGERRHVGCAPRSVVAEEEPNAPAPPRPALAKERAVARPEPPGTRRPQEGERGEATA